MRKLLSFFLLLVVLVVVAFLYMENRHFVKVENSPDPKATVHSSAYSPQTLQPNDDGGSNKSVLAPTKQPVDKQTVSSPHNLVNWGYVSGNDSDVFFSNYDAESSFYKQNGKRLDKLNDDTATYINMVNGWLYYSNRSDNEKIYRVLLDGSKREKISDDSAEYIVVSDGWIYYMNKSDVFNLYKVKTDGSSRTKLNDEDSLYLNVVDGWIYYCGGMYHNIFKIRVDGSDHTQLSDDKGSDINVVDGWIYYFNWNDNGIYKIKNDGTGRQELARGSDSITGLNVLAGWVYYSVAGNGIYKIKVDGTAKEQLTKINGGSINIYGNRLYFITDDSKLYSMNTDGTDLQMIDVPSNKPTLPEEVKRKAVDTVKKYLKTMKVAGYVEGSSHVDIDEIDNEGIISIHVYNVDSNQTQTINWYTYDTKTGKLTAHLK